ncbi:MAG: hypothetical protein ACRBB4_16795 [Neptuniibacter sp.]
MSVLVVFSHSLILVCALFLAGRSYRLSEKHNSTALMVISLAAAFISCAAAGDLLLSGNDQDSLTLKRLLDNLALFAAVPLIASALLDLSFKYNWSKAAWGRWLLALFALFELCRRSGIGTEYTQIMSALCAITIIFSALKLYPINVRVTGISSGIFLFLSLLVFGSATLLPEQQNTLYYSVTLAASLGFISQILPKIIEKNTETSQ